MRSKLLALILALNVMGWAQAATSNTAPVPEQNSAAAEAKADCPCCEKMGDVHDHAAMHKDMQACMHSKDGKDGMACCAGKDSKDGMPCCSGKDGKNTMACCQGKEANATAKDAKTASCCGSSSKSQEKEVSCCSAKDGKSAKGCCGANSCGKQNAEHATPGN